jgi:hypothetical protein
MAAGVLHFKNEYPCPSHLATDLPCESLSLNKQASEFVLFLLPWLTRALFFHSFLRANYELDALSLDIT